MVPQISLIIPGIRPEMFQNVYDSFLDCWHGTFEIIFVTPARLGALKLQDRGEIQWIQDFGCPSRALQIGFINAKADWVSFATDDCIFDKEAMNKAWKLLGDYKKVVVCKYTESNHWSKWMMTPCYYHAWFHSDFRTLNIPIWFRLYMNGLISKKIMTEIGGFDCKYETMAYTYNDLSMRLQFYGAKFIIAKDRLDHCSWQPAESGDHGPVSRACLEHDAPLFRGVYWAKHFKPQIKIDVNNWQNVASKWPRRFPQ